MKGKICMLGLLGALVTVPLVGLQVRTPPKAKPLIEQTTQNLDPRMIHEYFDLNRNGTYEYHRIVLEKDGQIKRIFGESYGLELSKELIESLPLQGDGRRFFTL